MDRRIGFMLGEEIPDNSSRKFKKTWKPKWNAATCGAAIKVAGGAAGCCFEREYGNLAGFFGSGITFEVFSGEQPSV
jgi:hypothetical protein